MEAPPHGVDYTPLTHTEVQKAKALKKDLTLHDEGIELLIVMLYRNFLFLMILRRVIF